MDGYQIEWKQSALHELRRLDRQAVPRIMAAVDGLNGNPLPPGVRKLYGCHHTYRLRIGDYRIVYEIFDARLVIQIVRVRHRQDVYRR